MEELIGMLLGFLFWAFLLFLLLWIPIFFIWILGIVKENTKIKYIEFLIPLLCFILLIWGIYDIHFVVHTGGLLPGFTLGPIMDNLPLIYLGLALIFSLKKCFKIYKK